MQIYPAGVIGLDSPAEELTVARNTVAALSEMEHALANRENPSDQVIASGAWNATNLGCLFFPAAVRVGYDPECILRELKDKLTKTGMPNGFVKGNPHGIENLSTVPNTLQEMMLLSHQGTIRLFPVWPRKLMGNAAFFGLRARGGFVVDATQREGEVSEVRVSCPVGGRLRLENPWPKRTAMVNSVALVGDALEIDTHPGDILEICAQ